MQNLSKDPAEQRVISLTHIEVSDKELFMNATLKILGAVFLVQLCLTASVLADQGRRNLDEEVMHRDRRFLARYSDGTT
ncbi:MAG: hypothetical protein ACREXR_18155, partial [Gammaproteobacteria bacterium]